jgi:hypothetical protein
MASSTSTPRIVTLATRISASVAELQERLAAQKYPSPTFAEDGPEGLPADVAPLRDAVLDATAELHELLLEPIQLLHEFAGVSSPILSGLWQELKLPRDYSLPQSES